MNLLFLTLLDFKSLDDRNIYTDLLRQFRENGHSVYVISPTERRNKINTHIIKEKNTVILKLKIGNTQKTNLIEKGISTITIEPLFVRAIKKYLSDVRFDLVMYSTPPITFFNAIKYVKTRDNAKTYLLLKDIFPQNSVDLNMLSKTGIKGIIYKYFRSKEKKLYSLSDKIGCMSPANVRYLLDHNAEIDKNRAEVCPNSVEPIDMSASPEERIVLRRKYDIPIDKTVFVYGGNLGRPQGIDFLIECLRSVKNSQIFFLIVGDGTEYGKLEDFICTDQPDNVKLMKRLPKEDYDKLIGSCDVGMIFLDYHFTIPNFPSRLLSYMQAGIPVLAVTDTATDIGAFLEKNGIGRSCYSGDVKQFTTALESISRETYRKEMIQKVLEDQFNVSDGYSIILRSIDENCCK